MIDQHQTGKWGEEIATTYLRNNSYQILEQNWRFSRAEIDIIAKLNDLLIFVEVKTRSYDHFGSPEDFVSSHQENLIIDTATQYMRQKGHDWAFRFDIIAILGKPDNYKLKHIEDAFFPGL